MDNEILILLGYLAGFLLVTFVLTALVVGLVNAVIRKVKKIQKPKLNMKSKLKLTLLYAVYLSCILIFMGGIFATTYGLSDSSGKHIQAGDCYRCDGIGKVLKNGIKISCPVCGGLGVNFITEYDSEVFFGIGIIGIIVGLVGAVLCFIKIHKCRTEAEDAYYAKMQKNIVHSGFNIQVKLYDTSYDTGGRTYARITYTFTDANTGAFLGRGTQGQVLTLSIDSSTKIKCHLGRGFKDVILRYRPYENAKYKVIPNIHNGIRFEETDSF